jgi:predicted PurR-regulated permease PerM
MAADGSPPEVGPHEEIRKEPAGAADTSGSRNQRAKPQTGARAGLQTRPQTAPTESDGSLPSTDVVWVRISPSQVVRAVVVALLSAAVVLGALFLVWQVRTFVSWFVAALFLAAMLNPLVNWFQRRHRMIKRPLAIALTYLGLVVALLLIVGIFVPVLVDQINALIKFVGGVASAPQGPQEYVKHLAQQNGLGSLYHKFSGQAGNIRGQVQDLAKSALSSTPEVITGIGGFFAALATILTITFFLILGSERYVNAGVGLFSEAHRPLVRSLVKQSAGAVTGYVTGNLAISAICGVTTFVVLLVLGMPYAAALALLVAVLDLIPLVGATLGGALLVIVGLFVAPWKGVVLLAFILVYQQIEGSVLQPLVYSRAVHLNGLVILIAVLVGGMLLGIPGALLAVPVAEIIRIVVTELLDYRRARREANEPASADRSQPAPR